MSPRVSQILHRREEIAQHQSVLKDLQAALTPEETAELAAAEKEIRPSGSDVSPEKAGTPGKPGGPK